MTDLTEEINEFWISVNYSMIYFTKHDIDQFFYSILKKGWPPKGTKAAFRHIKLRNPVSKAQLLDMSEEEMKLFLEMIEDDNNQSKMEMGK